MSVDVFTPRLSVLLTKTSHEQTQSNSSEDKTLDLTPYIGERGLVTTQKSINSPNNGFTIRLEDQWFKELAQSMYCAIEPMDVIEISMSRADEPEIVMRGVVTNIEVSMSMGGDGKPTRVLSITGGDYGCLLRMMQINFMKGYDVSKMLIGMSEQYFQSMFGIPYVSMTAGQFVQELTEKVFNKFIQKIGNKALMPLKPDVSGADSDDYVYPNGFQANPQGSLWSHLQTHGNLGPFYEVLFDDEKDKTTVLYRKPAFKKLSGDGYIFPASSAKDFDVPIEEISAWRRSRTERDIANYYYVRAPRGEFMRSMETTLQSIVGNGSQLSKKDYKNCLESLYGFRSMEVDTHHGSLKTQTIPGQKKDGYQAGGEGHSQYMLKQIKYLQDSNVDNVMFESGIILCAGRPDYKPGQYAKIKWPNGMEATSYVTSVTHTFEPYKSYTCTLKFERGTGFVKQNELSGYVEYLWGQGVY